MTAVLSQEQQQPTSALAAVPKAIWGVLGALALATAGLAGALVMRASNPPAAPATVAAAPIAPIAPATPVPQEAVAQKAIPQAPADMPEVGPAPKPQPKPVHKPAPAKVQQATGTAAQPAPQGTQMAQGAGPAPMVVQAPPVCRVCGTVQSVAEVKEKAQQGSGVGAVGGAVVGGLLGNQIGHGGGRTVATVLGAVGGGLAGNEIEKHVRTTTVYDVTVRMDDGSYRTIRHASPVAVGTAVTVDGNQLRTGGAASAPAQPAVIRTNG